MRYDETFGPAGQHSQLEHLLSLLPADAGYKHVVFQPAMAFVGNGAPAPEGFARREEEGLAILSRHPIRRSSYLLLPRDFSDNLDGHQRICLRAEVDVDGHG